MRLRTIPNTDLNASVICLGALPFGLTVGEDLSFSLMDRFFAAGGNFIDTALVYGEWLPVGRGQSERTVGTWLKQRGNRQSIIVSTKGDTPGSPACRFRGCRARRSAPTSMRACTTCRATTSTYTGCIEMTHSGL